jgi:hypothetical protein
MRYNYRSKKKDQTSLSYLDTLTKDELLEKKKEFEENIEIINIVFDQNDYDFFSQKKEKISEIKKAYKILENEFEKLDIQKKKRFFVKKGFFGGVSSASEVTYVLCEENNLTESVIKKLKEVINLTIEHNSKLFNHSVEDLTIRLSRKYRIPITSRPIDIESNENHPGIDYKVGHDFWALLLLNDIKIDAKNEYGGLLSTAAFETYDEIFHPKKIFPHDEFWTKNSIEVDRDYFKKVKDYGCIGFFIGSFFKEFKKINKDFQHTHFVEEVINEEFFKIWKSQLLEHLERYLRKTVLNLRSKERNKDLSENLNSIYILSNKSYENTYKVGWTSLLPEERAEQLSSETGVLHPFKVVYKKKFKDAEKIEKQIHKNFSEYRVKRNKEYFEISLEELKEYINSI